MLRRGDGSDKVAQVQRLLNQNGITTPPLQADGILGPRTEQAVRPYSKNRVLSYRWADGTNSQLSLYPTIAGRDDRHDLR